MLGARIISCDFNILQINGRYTGTWCTLIISYIRCPIILKLLYAVANEMSSNNNEQLKRIVQEHNTSAVLHELSTLLTITITLCILLNLLMDTRFPISVYSVIEIINGFKSYYF